MAYVKNKNKNRVTPAQATNQQTFVYWYNYLKLISLNIIKWENVPDSIDVRFLELALTEKGSVVWFIDEILNEQLCLTVNLGGKFNVYGIPTNYYAYSPYTPYYNRDLTEKNSVLIFNNFLRQNNENIIQVFANKLYLVDRSVDVNVNAQRTPVIMSATNQQQLTIKNLTNQYDGNEPFIFTDNTIDLSSFKVWNTQAPFVADKLESLKHNILNDFLSTFGVENSNSDKKERMVADEVGSNYGNVEISRNIYLGARQIAVQKINKIFGTDIKVSFNTELRTLINANQYVDEEV
jgi:hypothetical protein